MFNVVKRFETLTHERDRKGCETAKVAKRCETAKVAKVQFFWSILLANEWLGQLINGQLLAN